MTASTEDIDGEGERILAERAAILARPLPETGHQDFVEVAIFRLAGQRYAVEIAAVDAVFDVGVPTPLPGVPPFFLGLAHRRGLVFPVIDIGPFFGAAAAAPAGRRQALLIHAEASVAAFAADMVEGHERIAGDELAPVQGEAARHPSLRGLVRGDILLFDGRQLLAEARLTVDDRPARLHTIREAT